MEAPVYPAYGSTRSHSLPAKRAEEEEGARVAVGESPARAVRAAGGALTSSSVSRARSLHLRLRSRAASQALEVERASAGRERRAAVEVSRAPQERSIKPC